MNEEKDVFGAALWDYHCTPGDQELITWTSLTEKDPVPIGYFFRNFDQMPSIEQKAMELSQGKILDVGCGAGSHGLYLQNQKKLEVHKLEQAGGLQLYALDISGTYPGPTANIELIVGTKYLFIYKENPTRIS